MTRFLFAIGSLLLLGCAGATRPESIGSGSERTFVYGSIALDLDRHIERAGLSSDLADCSDRNWNCLSGNVFRVMTPKDCSDLDRTFYGSGDLRTEVLRRENGPQADRTINATFRQTALLLGNPERSNVVYVYSPFGIAGVYYDALSRYDLVTMAREGGLAALSTLAGQDNGFYFPAASLSIWGGCRTAVVG